MWSSKNVDEGLTLAQAGTWQRWDQECVGLICWICFVHLMLSFCLAVSSVWAWATVKLQSKRNHKATLKRNKTKWLIILASCSHAQTETHPFLANPGRLATHALSSCKKTLSPFTNCITKHFHSLSLHRCRLTPSLLSAMPFCLLIDGALVTGAHWLSSTHHRQMQPQKDRFAGTKVESNGNALQNETRTFKGVNMCQLPLASGTPSSELRYFTRTCISVYVLPCRQGDAMMQRTHSMLENLMRGCTVLVPQVSVCYKRFKRCRDMLCRGQWPAKDMND